MWDAFAPHKLEVMLKEVTYLTNVNTEYEKLVATIHQGMLNYDGFDNLRVEHNITLIGKSGAKHQIDVFWEFKAAGTTYRTCVECKNYSSSVKKLHVAAFASVLNDIGNANGIIATTSSFQKGALLLAKENNIRLVTVNHLLQSIHLTMNPTQSNIDNLQFQFSRDSIVSALKRNNITELNFNYMINGNDFLLDENNNPVIKIADLIRSHVKNEGENIIENVNLFFNFETVGLLKISSLSFRLTKVQLPTIESTISLPTTAKAVIEDIVENNIYYLHDDGSVSAPSDNRA